MLKNSSKSSRVIWLCSKIFLVTAFVATTLGFLLLAGCNQSESSDEGEEISAKITIENLALGKPVQASMALSENAAEMAVDGDLGTLWNAGGYAPQWLEIDLGEPFTIGQIRLRVAQSPAGLTVHRVRGKKSKEEEYVLLHDFMEETNDSFVLDYVPPTPWENVRFVRVETKTGPSWVAWREIEIFSQPLEESSQ